MIKKINISESEKENILKLHKKLNENTGLSLYGVVVDIETNEPVFDTKLTLSKDNVTKGMLKTDEEGNYKFENLDSGSYSLKVENALQGYLTQTQQIELTTSSLEQKILLSKKLKDLSEVVVVSKKLSIFDFNFIDDEGNKIPNVTFTLYKDKKRELGTYTSPNGESKISFDVNDIQIKNNESVTYPEDNKEGFFYTETPGSCKEFKDIIVVAKAKNYLETKKTISFCLNNGAYNAMTSKNNGIVTATPANGENGIPQRVGSNTNTNFFNIELLKPQISANIITLNREDDVLPNVKIDIYKDKTKESFLQSIETNQNGEAILNITSGDFELFTDENEPIKKVRLYFFIRKEGYKDTFESKIIKYGKEDEVKIVLYPIKPVKVPKPKEISIRECRITTKKFHRDLVSVIRNKKTMEELGGDEAIEETRTQVQWCYMKYKDRYSNNMQKIINKLSNVPPKYDIFELRFTLEQQRDIYKENRNMGIVHTIRKVVSEQSEKKSLLINESKIIKNRFLFVLKSSNKKTLKNNMIEESRELLQTGYDKSLVKENFLEIMKTVKDSGKFLTDVKSQLGQKIADTVKDKQQEHEMILNAFNDLDPAIVERAFKENRVDELSEIISKKALENYKTQFGDTGIFGSMVASVDTEKFKSEVAKLIQTSIDAVSDDLDSKVQDAVTEE